MLLQHRSILFIGCDIHNSFILYGGYEILVAIITQTYFICQERVLIKQYKTNPEDAFWDYWITYFKDFLFSAAEISVYNFIFMIDLAASITSSTIVTAFLYPIQRLKIEMQLNKQDGSIATNTKAILDRQGIHGFYQGLSPLIIGNGLAYGIYFVAYQKLKNILHTDPNSSLSIIQCSGLAGIIGSLFTNPFYVLQTRQSKQDVPVLTLLNKLIQNEGILALWKGILASLILVSNPIIQFVVYQWLKKRFSRNGKELTSLVVFLIGAISKILATFCTYPYTLLRTRQQIKTDIKTQTLKSVFNQILQKEGFKGVFKGLIPKLIQTTLNSALLLMIYEKIRSQLMKISK